MTHLQDQYTVNQIETLENKIAELNAELNYNKAWLHLDNLAHTQNTVLVDYLAAHYNESTQPAFDANAFRNCSNSEYFKCGNIVKRAISSYKIKADTKKNPKWANEAIKAAKIVDEYNTKRHG